MTHHTSDDEHHSSANNSPCNYSANGCVLKLSRKRMREGTRSAHTPQLTGSSVPKPSTSEQKHLVDGKSTAAESERVREGEGVRETHTHTHTDPKHTRTQPLNSLTHLCRMPSTCSSTPARLPSTSSKKSDSTSSTLSLFRLSWKCEADST